MYFLIWLLSVKSILAVGILIDFLVFVFSVICFIVSCPATYIMFNLFRLLRFCSRSFLFWWGVISQCRFYCSYYFSLDDTYNFVTSYLFLCMPVFTLPLWLHNSVPFIYSSFLLIIWSGVFIFSSLVTLISFYLWNISVIHLSDFVNKNNKRNINCFIGTPHPCIIFF